jgi:chaperonin GroES
VIAVGNGQITDNGVRALDVKVGDKVLFGTYAGTTVKVSGEELLIMKESDILAVLKANFQPFISDQVKSKNSEFK